MHQQTRTQSTGLSTLPSDRERQDASEKIRQNLNKILEALENLYNNRLSPKDKSYLAGLFTTGCVSFSLHAIKKCFQDMPTKSEKVLKALDWLSKEGNIDSVAGMAGYVACAGAHLYQASRNKPAPGPQGPHPEKPQGQ